MIGINPSTSSVSSNNIGQIGYCNFPLLTLYSTSFILHGTSKIIVLPSKFSLYQYSNALLASLLVYSSPL